MIKYYLPAHSTHFHGELRFEAYSHSTKNDREESSERGCIILLKKYFSNIFFPQVSVYTHTSYFMCGMEQPQR